jgi:serine phosphatase RsbU (regulator of sigma subunit)
MSLRLRLVVAFFLLSVVPLGAVTFYAYTSNVRALQVAAQHESEILTGELTQRMQVVTNQISDRVEHLMDMPVSNATVTGTTGKAAAEPQKIVARKSPPAKKPETTVAVNAPAAPVPPAPAPAPALSNVTAVTIDPNTMQGQVAGALGEVALLLNNVELRGLGRGTTTPDAALRAGNLSRGGFPPGAFGGRGGGGRGRPDVGAPSGPGIPPPTGAMPLESAGREGENARRGGRRFPPPGPPPAPDAAGAPAPPDDPTHMKLDLAPIRRELFRELTSDKDFQQLTPEERQRIGREVNQRLLGIVQGIQLSAAELQKKAAAQQQNALALAEGKTPGVPGAPIAPPVPPAPAIEAPAAPATVTRSTSAPAPVSAPRPSPAPAPNETAKAPAAPSLPKPIMKKALTGNRLNVRFERNGQVVRQVNAEINLPNLLATVFANTRRDSGEIPFAVGKDGQLYTPTEADRARLASLDVTRVDEAPGTKRLDDWIVVTMPDRSGAGLRFGIARPVGQLLTDLRRTTARNAGFGLLFIAIALVGIVPLSGRLTRNLSSLTDAVSRIAKGDYAARVPVKSRDEIGRLADAFNRMAADVERHQHAAVEQERIRRELELGRRIQSEMLPHEPLHFGPSEIKGVSVPAREVGGDFFNYFPLDSGLVAMLVGDVSGKGVGAALLMANIQASLRTRFALGQGLSAIAEAIDRDIEANSPGPVYATLFIAIFDPATRHMRYVNAGHNPQFVLRAQGNIEKMSSTGLPVGMLAGHGYSERDVQLAPGDLLFFYTDGCVEMENEAGEMFGSDRLETLVAGSSSGSADEVLMKVEKAISAFRGSREQFDDATMMAVRIG